MKESEASDGTRLHALICAMLTRVNFNTALNKFDKQSEESWGELAEDIKKMIVNNMPVMADPVSQLRLLKKE